MKSGLACALSAFARAGALAAQGQHPNHSLVLIASVDEEDFMRGAEKAIVSEWVTENDWVLDAEPTNGEIRMAHKGHTWFQVSVEGVTAHASTPYKGADVIAGTLHNTNCMSYGPGNLELAHKPDESVDIADILRCEKVFTHLITQMLYKDLTETPSGI